MKGSVGFIVLGLLAVGVMLIAIGYSQPSIQLPIQPSNNETQPRIDEPVYPWTPANQTLPADQPSPPNDEAPPSTPQTPAAPTTPTAPTVTYSTKTIFTYLLKSGITVSQTVTYPVNYTHKFVVEISALVALSVVPGEGGGVLPTVEVYIDNVLVHKFVGPIPLMESVDSPTYYTRRATTIQVKCVAGSSGSSQCTVTVRCTNWPSTYAVLGAVGISDLSFFGLLLIAAAVVLMVVFRK